MPQKLVKRLCCSLAANPLCATGQLWRVVAKDTAGLKGVELSEGHTNYRFPIRLIFRDNLILVEDVIIIQNLIDRFFDANNFVRADRKHSNYPLASGTSRKVDQWPSAHLS